MSIEKGEKCVVCAAYLFEDDDVVFCPVCGAPHHRDCYNKIGHCAQEEFHGTENEYKKPVQQQQEQQREEKPMVECGMCSQLYDAEERTCPNCNTPNTYKMGNGFFAYDFLGGVDPNMDLGEGVTAEEAKRFVVANTPRFIPRFAQFRMGKKSSWNWLACLLPSAWFLHRKIYGVGAVIAALSVAASMLTIPFSNRLYELGYTGGSMMLLDYAVSDFGVSVLLAGLVGAFLSLTISLISGAFADRIYYKHVIKNVSQIKAESDDIERDFRRKGATSFFMIFVGWTAVSYLPALILSIFGF